MANGVEHLVMCFFVIPISFVECLSNSCPFFIGLLVLHWTETSFYIPVFKQEKSLEIIPSCVSFNPYFSLCGFHHIFQNKGSHGLSNEANSLALKLLFLNLLKHFIAVLYFPFRSSWELGKWQSHEKEMCLVLGSEYNGKIHRHIYFSFFFSLSSLIFCFLALSSEFIFLISKALI